MHLFEQIDRTVKPTRYTGSRLRRIDFGYNDHPLTTSSAFGIFLVAVSGTQCNTFRYNWFGNLYLIVYFTLN